jgi:hypothetical protein
VSALEQPSRGRRRPERRTWLRRIGLAAAMVVLFAVGVALGLALHDDPEPGGTVTQIRTLEPRPQQPATTP